MNEVTPILICFVLAVLCLLGMLFQPALKKAAWQSELRRHNQRMKERQARLENFRNPPKK